MLKGPNRRIAGGRISRLDRAAFLIAAGPSESLRLPWPIQAGSRLGMPCYTLLSFGVLRPFTRLMQSNFLALHFAGVASDEASFTQWRSVNFIVSNQSPGDAVADGTGLPAVAAATDGDLDVEPVQHLYFGQRLADHHARGFPAKILVEWTFVDYDFPRAAADAHSRCGRLSATGALIYLFSLSHLRYQLELLV